MIENTDKGFWPMFWKCFVVSLATALTLASLSGCKTLFESNKAKKQEATDSVNVKKGNEGLSKGDTTKTEKTNTKETIYYPQPIYIQGKDGKTEVVFVPQSTKETGTEKINNGMFEQWKKNFEDSLRYSQSLRDKQTETKAEAKTDPMFIFAFAFLALVLLAIVFMLYKLSNKFNLLKK